MKKLIFFAVALVVFLSAGISAHASADAQAALLRRLIISGFSEPELLIGHFNHIDALSSEEMKTIDTYINAAASALGQVQAYIDQGLSSGEKTKVITDLEAAARLMKLSFAVTVMQPQAFRLSGEDDQGEPLIAFEQPEDQDGDDPVFYYYLTDFVPVSIPVSELLQSGDYYGDFFRMNVYQRQAEEQLFARDELTGPLGGRGRAICGNPISDFAFNIVFACAQKTSCQAQSPLLSALSFDIGAFSVTGKDSDFKSVSGIRTIVASMKEVVKAIGAYQASEAQSAVSPSPAPDTQRRLPDTATNYGSVAFVGMILIGIAVFIILAVKKMASIAHMDK